jgi:hypothetical protein
LLVLPCGPLVVAGVDGGGLVPAFPLGVSLVGVAHKLYLVGYLLQTPSSWLISYLTGFVAMAHNGCIPSEPLNHHGPHRLLPCIHL